MAPVIVILLAFVLMTLHISATALPTEVPGREQAGHEQEVGYEQVRPEQAGHVARLVNQADCLIACNGGVWPFVVRLMSSLYQARLHSLSLLTAIFVTHCTPLFLLLYRHFAGRSCRHEYHSIA